jgi:diguanylate cyclase (GGDEF)-like protein
VLYLLSRRQSFAQSEDVVRLDMITITVADISLTAILGVLLLFAWFQNRGTQSLGWWGAAHLILGAAVVAIGVGNAVHIPALTNVGLAAMVFAYALMWNAARSFEGRDVRPLWVFAGPCFWLLASLSGAARSIDVEVMISSSILAIYNFAGAYEYWRGRAERLISRWPAITLLVVTGAGFLSWVALAVWRPIAVSGSIYSSEWFPTVILVTLLGRVALAFIVLAMAKERLEQAQRTEALTDPLTGLPNRRAFFRRAARRVRPVGIQKVAVLLFDLDHFKLVNDRYGHAFGDRVLKAFADTLMQSVKATDVIGRVGGEEFAALLPEASLEEAIAVAERVRSEYARTVSTLDGVQVRSTVSVGVAGCAKVADCSLHAMLLRADVALYAAKEAGRDCVRFENPSHPIRPRADALPGKRRLAAPQTMGIERVFDNPVT